MKLTRREMLKLAAVTLTTSAFSPNALWAEDSPAHPVSLISACDWNLTGRNQPSGFDLAKKIGLDGVQVSFEVIEGTPFDLRKTENQQLYLQKSAETGVKISSFALGDGNGHPLWKLEDGEKRLSDALDCMAAMGFHGCILVPFFGPAYLDTDDKFAVTIQRLKNLAPKAKDLGVVMAIETPLKAEGNLRVIEGVNDTQAVQVYYDPGNMKNYHKMDADAVRQDLLKLKGLIAEAHAKDTGLLGKGLDYGKILAAYREIGYFGWQTLEGAVDKKLGLEESYRQNAAYLRTL